MRTTKGSSIILRVHNNDNNGLCIGTWLAILAKSALGGALTIAFTQYLWTVMRATMPSLKVMDSIFSRMTDFLSFRDIELSEDFVCDGSACMVRRETPLSEDPLNNQRILFNCLAINKPSVWLSTGI